MSKGGEITFSECRRLLDPIPDSTLSRLLQRLVHHRLLASGQKGYQLGPRIETWRQLLGCESSFDEMASLRHCIHSLAAEVRESTGFIALIDDHIEVIDSVSWRDSIRIVAPGEPFMFQADHAGVLAIFERLPAPRTETLIRSQFSEIPDPAEYHRCREQFRVEHPSSDLPLFLDRSRSRPGVSRYAIPALWRGQPAALFLCLPTARIQGREELLASALIRHVRAVP
ncbi:MAG: hypothetical protein D6820_18880 [Lentisphaerae bacterium]|nr:MAG: hypothetical protein D6820_18880 [Lentisphaerota bacterium]